MQAAETHLWLLPSWSSWPRRLGRKDGKEIVFIYRPQIGFKKRV
jgi:hypothetical protein